MNLWIVLKEAKVMDRITIHRTHNHFFIILENGFCVLQLLDKLWYSMVTLRTTSPAPTTCRLVSIIPLFASTTKPVAEPFPGVSVSNHYNQEPWAEYAIQFESFTLGLLSFKVTMAGTTSWSVFFQFATAFGCVASNSAANFSFNCFSIFIA